MEFWEELPDQCPPGDAVSDAISQAFRIVYSNPPKSEHFRSYRYLNKALAPGGDECRHASCSLATTVERARELAAFPKVRDKGPLIAAVSVAAGSGLWKKKRDHIDLWIFGGCDPCAWVTSVEHP